MSWGLLVPAPPASAPAAPPCPAPKPAGPVSATVPAVELPREPAATEMVFEAPERAPTDRPTAAWKSWLTLVSTLVAPPLSALVSALVRASAGKEMDALAGAAPRSVASAPVAVRTPARRRALAFMLAPSRYP